jgi:hypothetical protein
MTAKQESNRLVWRTTLLTLGLTAAFIFGVIVLAGGDWLPGTIIVVASGFALAAQIRVIAKLRSGPSRPHGKRSG